MASFVRRNRLPVLVGLPAGMLYEWFYLRGSGEEGERKMAAKGPLVAPTVSEEEAAVVRELDERLKRIREARNKA